MHWGLDDRDPTLLSGSGVPERQQDKAPELEGRELSGCCSARCDTLVTGLFSPPQL